MSCAYLYSGRTGREIFRVTDFNNNFPIPRVGETIKLDRNRYTVESVKVRESSTLLTEYRVRVMLVEES